MRLRKHTAPDPVLEGLDGLILLGTIAYTVLRSLYGQESKSVTALPALSEGSHEEKGEVLMEEVHGTWVPMRMRKDPV